MQGVAVIPEHSIGGDHLVRPLDEACAFRSRPSIFRTDNGKEFNSRTMLTWAHCHGIGLKLIEPGKPNQNAFIEPLHGRLRDKCLNNLWSVSLNHFRVIIRAWTQEHNEYRLKNALGDWRPPSTPSSLLQRSLPSTQGSRSNR